jgi:hypothetical protein
MPVGVEFPYRAGATPCADDHPLWSRYRATIERAETVLVQARITREQPDYAERFAELFRQAPQWEAWDSTTQKCVRDYQSRQKQKRGKAEFSTSREAARKRVAAERAEIDVTGAEYLDTLRGGEGAKRKRKPSSTAKRPKKAAAKAATKPKPKRKSVRVVDLSEVPF